MKKENNLIQAKTCWYGESQKLVKGIFTNYRRLCEKEKQKPIQFFNEADALFSKRKDSNFSNVAQTENAIQNIILEEVLHGTRPTLSEIEELCRHEKIGDGGKGSCIGFQA